MDEIREFKVVPELEINKTDEELYLEDLIEKEQDIKEHHVIKAFCKDYYSSSFLGKLTYSRATRQIVKPFFWMLDQYRSRREKANESGKKKFLRDEKKPIEIHSVRTAQHLKREGCSPLDISVGLMHDVPEDLAKTPEQLFDMLHDLENKFGYERRANVYALTNKHKLILRTMERNGIIDLEDIKKELKTYDNEKNKKKYIFRFQSWALLNRLNDYEKRDDTADIMFKLKRDTFPLYLMNSKDFMNNVYEKKRVKSLFVLPRSKTSDRLDNTGSMWFRKYEKQEDVLIRNINLFDSFREYYTDKDIKIYDPITHNLVKKLIYHSLKEVDTEINSLNQRNNSETKQPLERFISLRDKIMKTRSHIIYER